MKLSFLGKYVLADFGLRVGKKALDLREKRARAREQEPEHGWEPYNRAEATALVKSVFDYPLFQARWDNDPSEACCWVIKMDPSKFLRTFGIPKPKAARG